MKILIAEDNPVSRALLKEILLSIPDWDVAEAEDGKQGWDILAGGYGAHLLISDIQMPNWTGLQLVSNMRGDARFKSMPVMLISSVREKETIVEAAALGIQAYILKPFNAEKVIVQVKKIEETLPSSARLTILAEPGKVMERAGLQVGGYLNALDDMIADANRGAQEARDLMLKGNRRDAKIRLDNVKGSALIFGAGYLIEALDGTMSWIGDESQFRDMSGLNAEVTRLQGARDDLRARHKNGESISGPRVKSSATGPRYIPVNEDAVMNKIIRDPKLVMESLGVDGEKYLQLFDLCLKDLQESNLQIKGLVLKGDREAARVRLEAMKGGCLTFGADYYLQAVLETINWILDEKQFKDVDELQTQLQRLLEVRQAIKLVPEGGAAPVTSSVAPTAPAPPVAPPPPPPGASAVAPPPPPPPPPPMRPRMQDLSDFADYLPPPDLERLKWVISVATNSQYDLKPWQALRLGLRLAPTMSFSPTEFYNVLMEDFESTQGGKSSAPPAPPAPPGAPAPPAPPAPPMKPRMQDLSDFAFYLPPRDLERLKWIISVATNSQYDLKPWQAMRLAMRLTPTMAFSPTEIYNVLMEDYESTQGKNG